VVVDFSTALPDGPFDAVVSALAIHHLAHDEKRALFARIHHALVPGGVFVNAEQVAGPTPSLDAHYRAVWDVHTRACGATDDDLAEAAVRMSVDRCASVDEQCAWLRDAGFTDVDVFFKAWRFAVFGGWRAP
jgi:tRNA (cmo5U34)-methyltransferase